MNATLLAHIPVSLLERWEIDAEIEQQVKKTVPQSWTPPKPKEKQEKPKVDDDDGFTVVKKGRKTRNFTQAKPVQVSDSCYKALPSGKAQVSQKQGSFESATAKKNRKRAEKKRKLAQNSD
jgi:hypothetical protein